MTRTTCSTLSLVIVAGICLATPVVYGEEATELWERATDLLNRKDSKKEELQEAVQILRRIGTEFPDSPIADDALLLTGTTLLDDLADPVVTQEVFTQLVELYPESRAAGLAEDRLQVLKEDLGPNNRHARAVAEFQHIRLDSQKRPWQETTTMTQDLIARYPHWSKIFEVRLWLAGIYVRHEQPNEALLQYEAVFLAKNAPRELTVQALRSAINLHTHNKDFSQAADLLQKARALGTHTPGEVHSLTALTDELHKAILRSKRLKVSKILVVLAPLVLVFCLLFTTRSVRQTVRQLRKVDSRVVYMAPVAGLLCIMAFTGHEQIGPAVTLICVSGLGATWLGSALMRARYKVGTNVAFWAILTVVLVTLSTGAVSYIALQHSELWDQLVTTVRLGPE